MEAVVSFSFGPVLLCVGVILRQIPCGGCQELWAFFLPVQPHQKEESFSFPKAFAFADILGFLLIVLTHLTCSSLNLDC